MGLCKNDFKLAQLRQYEIYIMEASNTNTNEHTEAK